MTAGDDHGTGEAAALPPVLQDLVTGMHRRSPAALARAISLVEGEGPGARSLLHALLSEAPEPAARIGFTGPPGAGKSSLVSSIARLLRRGEEAVGVLAVDPSSPFTGGALLGDRIRMNDLATDPGIFIRSTASRGSLGGLATTSKEILDLMDAFGFSRLLVETVGVGQTEMEIVEAVDTVVVVLVPESGDAVQAMKAGLMELADVFVVNKADRPGAEGMAREIRMALELAARRGGERGPSGRTDSAMASGWVPPVLLTTAHRDEGSEALLDHLDRHRRHLQESGELEARRRHRARARIRDVLDREMKRRARGLLASGPLVEEAVTRILGGRATAYSVAAELIERMDRVGIAESG